MMRVTRPEGNPRWAFTLIELLVVMLIILVVSAAALPVVLPALRQRQVGEASRIFQAALAGARDAAIASNAPRGIRLLPDQVLTQPPLGHSISATVNGNTVQVSDAGTRTWACNRFIPIQPAPDYLEGAVRFRDTANTFLTDIVGSANFPQFQHAKVIFQSSLNNVAGSTVPISLTSWAWNIRVGDKIQIDSSGQLYTIIGPVCTANPNRFINYVAQDGTSLNPLPNDPTSGIPPEFLFVVNGVDDNADGFIDNGFDGIDNNGNGLTDELIESDSTVSGETEVWIGSQVTQSTTSTVHNYRIIRRPVPSPGARETLLPSNVVIDLTGWNRDDGLPLERSRLPIDGNVPWLYPYDADTRSIDILIEPSGRVIPTTLFSSPSKFGNLPFFHFWLTDREGVVDPLWGMGADSTKFPVITHNPLATATTVTDRRFYLLPMPKGTPSYPTDTTFLEGERMLITLFTRTGNLTITSLQNFDATNFNVPFYSAQQGVKESP